MCRPVTGKSPSTFQLNQIITTFERLSRWSYFRSDLFSPSTRVLGIFCQFLCCWSTTCLEHNWQIHLFNIFEVTFYRTEHCFLKVKNSFHGSGNFSMHSPESPLFLLNRLKTVQLRIMPYIENLTDYKSLRQNGQVLIIIVKHLFYTKYSSTQVLLQIYFQNFTDDLDIINLPMTTTTQSTTTKEPSKETEVSFWLANWLMRSELLTWH